MAFHHRFVRDRVYSDGLLEEPEEEHTPATRFPPVKAEGEFVQVIVQVLQAHRPLVRAHQPPLEEGDHSMNSRHQFRWRFLVPFQKCDVVAVTFASHRLVAQPSVGVNDAARLHRNLYKTHQACRRGVPDSAHPNATDTRSIFLSRHYNQCFAFSLAAANTFLQAAEVRLIYFDPSGHAIPVRAHHGASQFMQPRPSRLVTLEPQHPLKAHGARTVLLAGDPPSRPKPKGQGLAGILKDRPSSHRTLVVAIRTLQKNAGFWPALSPATARAAKAVRPTEPKQILPAGRLRRKASLKFHQIPRKILHRRPYYRLGLPESSKYPLGAKLCALPITRIGQYDSPGNLLFHRLPYLLQSNLWLGLK